MRKTKRSISYNYNSGYKLKTISAGSLLREKFEKRELLLGNWLRERMLVLVHAPTGVGKSWFVWSVALGIATGKGFSDWQCPSPKKVLIIDGEMQSDDLQERLGYLIKCFELNTEEIKLAKRNIKILARQYQDPELDFPDISNESEQLDVLEIIRKQNPQLVIMDNLSTLADLPDENAASSYNQIFKFLAKLKQERSGILVHHDKKGTDENSREAYRGSSKMEAIFEQRIHLSQVIDPPKPVNIGAYFRMEFWKNRYISDNLEPRIFSLHTSLGWDIKSDEDKRMKEFAELVKLREYNSAQELADHFNCTPSWATKSKKRCIKLGYLSEGHWINFIKEGKKQRTLNH